MSTAAEQLAQAMRASMEPLFFKSENMLSVCDFAANSLASMEPLFFKAENAPSLRWGGAPRKELQWSRFFSKRKIIRNTSIRPGNHHASMEPLFFKAENSYRRLPLADSLRRFNGAAFFQSGKSVTGQPGPRRYLGLQWSRFFSKRKIVRSDGSGCARSGCFNGAAFFQSGK